MSHLVVLSSPAQAAGSTNAASRFTNVFNQPITLGPTSSITLRSVSLPILPTVQVTALNAAMTFKASAGGVERAVTLTQGDYATPAALAEEMEKALNNAMRLEGASSTTATSHKVDVIVDQGVASAYTFSRYTNSPSRPTYGQAGLRGAVAQNVAGNQLITKQNPVSGVWDCLAYPEQRFSRGSGITRWVAPAADSAGPAVFTMCALVNLMTDTATPHTYGPEAMSAGGIMLMYQEGGPYRIYSPTHPAGIDLAVNGTPEDEIFLHRQSGIYIWSVRPKGAAALQTLYQQENTLGGLITQPRQLVVALSILNAPQGVTQGNISPDIMHHMPAAPLVADDFYDRGAADVTLEQVDGELGDDQPTIATYGFGDLYHQLGMPQASITTQTAAATRVTSSRPIKGTGVLPAMRIDCDLPLQTRSGYDGKTHSTLAVIMRPELVNGRTIFNDGAPLELALRYSTPTTINSITVALLDLAGQELPIQGDCTIVVALRE